MENQMHYIPFILKGLLILLAFYATFLGIVRIKKIGFYSIFTILTFSALIQIFVTSIMITNSNGNRNLPFINHSINIYLLLEFIIITYFFFKKINFIQLKKIILLTNGLFLAWLIFSYTINLNYMTENFSTIAAIEAIIILTECIFLFTQTLEEDTHLSLLQSADFILTAGIFFFFSFTCPYYILNIFYKNENKTLYDNLSMINDFGYVIMNFSIIKAYKCKIRTNLLLSS